LVLEEEGSIKGLPGLIPGSFGYHGENGNIVSNQVEKRTRKYSEGFSTNDIIGCGWDKIEGAVFFTKNGINLGLAFKNISGSFFPAVVFPQRECLFL